MLKARKRITKKELKHDPMLESIYKIETFVREYSKQALYGGGALVAIIVLAVMMYSSKKEAERKADYCMNNPS